MRVFLFAIFLITCSSGHIVRAEGETYSFGIPPIYTEEGIGEYFPSFIQYLEKEMQVSIQLVVSNSYEELIEKIISNEVQFAILGPTQYVHTKLKYPQLRYVATTQIIEDGKPRAYYFGEILVRKDSNITDLMQLQNKRFAFINPHSASGYRFPRIFLYKKGILPEKFFAEVRFAGSHQKGTDLLAEGKIDAVSTWELNFLEAEQRHGPIFRSIARIGPIAQLAVVTNHTLSESINSSFKEALVNMPPDVCHENFPFSGFQIFSDSSYNNVREISNFPFLDTYAPNALNSAVKSGDINLIFAAFDSLHYQKGIIHEFIHNELLGKVVSFTGDITGEVQDIAYGDGWYSLKKGLRISINSDRMLYVKWALETALKLNADKRMQGTIIGIKDNDTLIIEPIEPSAVTGE